MFRLTVVGDKLKSDQVGGFSQDTPLDETEVHGSFEFDADVPMRWTWQKSDPLGEISKGDRQAIRELIERLAEACRTRDPAAPVYWGTPWHAAEETCQYYGKLAKNDRDHDAKMAMSAPRFEVLTGPEDQWQVIAGPRLALVYVLQPANYGRLFEDAERWKAEHYLLYLGCSRQGDLPPDAPRPVYMSIDRIWFTKVNGKWKMLHRLWD
jgi:hypothetical protein